jgi:hypothetical protein
MSKFDEFIEKASMIADIATQKAKDATTISGLKFKLVSVGYDIKETYQRLGSAVYNMTKNEYQDEEIIKALVEEIDELNAQKEEIKDRIDKIKDK